MQKKEYSTPITIDQKNIREGKKNLHLKVKENPNTLQSTINNKKMNINQITDKNFDTTYEKKSVITYNENQLISKRKRSISYRAKQPSSKKNSNKKEMKINV